MLILGRTYRFRAPVVQGKQRPRHGNGHTYTPQGTKDAQEAIAMAFVAATQGKGRRMAPMGVPVDIQVDIYRPLSARTARQADAVAEWDLRKPDVDNVLKTVMDALEGVAYENDCQVCDARVVRHWAYRKQRQDEVEVTVTVPRRWDERWSVYRDQEEV